MNGTIGRDGSPVAFVLISTWMGPLRETVYLAVAFVLTWTIGRDGSPVAFVLDLLGWDHWERQVT